jgi:plastocyanin
MSILGRKVSLKTIAAVAVFFVAVVGLLPVMGLPLRGTKARAVTLVARDMAFYLDGDSKNANPNIQAKAGETIRIVVRNRDRGMTHDFSVPASKASTNALDWNEQDEVTFTVPDKPGSYEYVCRPHLLMMKGQLIVTN